MSLKLLPLLLLATLVAPFGAAQGTGMTIEGPNEPLVVMPGETTTLTYTITVGCIEFLSAGDTSMAVAVTTNLPTAFGASSDGVTLDAGQECLSASGSVEGTADVDITPTMAPIAYKPETFTVTATAGDLTATDDHSEEIVVGYMGGHEMTSNLTFPYEFTDADEGQVNFDVNLTINANGKTMVMFEQLGANGTVSGLFHQTFDVAAGETSRSLSVTWKPPAGAWEEDSITFYTYSHSLEGAADPWNAQNVTWTIKNMASEPQDDDNGGDEGIPGAPVMLLGLALLGAAFIARRS